MGIKMMAARRRSAPQHPCPVEDLTDADRGHLLCALCPAEVTWVNPAVRETSSGRWFITRFVRLQRGARHDPDCRFQVSAAITHLVATATSLDGGRHLLELNNGVAVVRIHVLEEALRVLRDAAQRRREQQDAALALATSLQGRLYVTTSQRLADYLTTATAVARLRALVLGQAGQELQRRIHLMVQGRVIPWSSFFYHLDRYPALCAAIGTGGEPSAVIAIEVIPWTSSVLPSGMMHWQCRQCQRRTEAGAPWSLIIPHLYVLPAAVASIHPGFIHLVVAQVVVRPRSSATALPGQSSTLFMNIDITVHHPAQIGRLEPVDLGDPSAGEVACE